MGLVFRGFGLTEEAMGARITVNLTATGEFEIRLNEQGRDLLVRESPISSS
jgi:hypothetical protein